MGERRGGGSSVGRENEMLRGAEGVGNNEMQRGAEGVGNNEMQRGAEGVGNNEMQRGRTELEQKQQLPEVEKMNGEFTFDKWTLNWTGGVGAGGGGNPIN